MSHWYGSPQDNTFRHASRGPTPISYNHRPRLRTPNILPQYLSRPSSDFGMDMDNYCSSGRRTSRNTGRPGSNLSHTPRHEPLSSSPLYDPVEALLSLNDAGRRINVSERRENIRPISGIIRNHVPISAPLPLSYAVRGKGAYKSILSVGEEEDEAREEDTPETNGKSDHPISVTSHPDPQDQSTGTTTKPVRSNMAARPITPSTLMALTEPCLMAWCYRLNDDKNEMPESTAVPAFNTTLNDANMQKVSSQLIDYRAATTQNTWGY